MTYGINRFSLIVLIASLLFASASLAGAGDQDRSAGNVPPARPTRPGLKAPLKSKPPILLAGRRQNASRRNKEHCEIWCKNNPECEFCSTRRGCGSGYDRMRSWGGRGRNYHACKRRQSRDEAVSSKLQQCHVWCRANQA